MRIGLISCYISAFSIQTIFALTIAGPLNGWTLNEGITFALSWLRDDLPTGNNDGALDVLLVKDVAASSVVATLKTDVAAIGLITSITIPTNIPSGQYYLQLKVTSGGETSAVGGPYNVVSGSSSASSDTSEMAGTTISGIIYSTPTAAVGNPFASLPTDGSSYFGTVKSGMPTGSIVGIAVGIILAVAILIGGVYIWLRRIRLFRMTAYKPKEEDQTYESPQQNQSQSNSSRNGYDPHNPQIPMNTHQSRTHGVSTLTPYHYNSDSSAQEINAQNLYAASSIPGSPVGSQPPHQMPSQYQPPGHAESSSTQDNATYSSPNLNDSTSVLNPAHTDDSRERHVPHLFEGIRRSPPHTSDSVSLQPPQ